MRVERAVIDTNVLISAALSQASPPAQVVRFFLAKGRILFSDATFEEFETRLWRPKFDRYFNLETRAQLLHDFSAAAVWIDVPHGIASLRHSRDPDDDKFVHAALAGHAHMLVTGDLDLLDLGMVDTLPILSPAAAWGSLSHVG